IATQEVSTWTPEIGYPGDIWGDGRDLYYSNTKARDIERVSLTTGERSSFVGQACATTICDSADGAGISARFGVVGALWGDGAILYAADGCFVRKIVIATAEVTTLGFIPGPCNISEIWGN